MITVNRPFDHMVLVLFVWFIRCIDQKAFVMTVLTKTKSSKSIAHIIGKLLCHILEYKMLKFGDETRLVHCKK